MDRAALRELLPLVSSSALHDVLVRVHDHPCAIVGLATPTPDRVLFGPAATIRFLPYRADLGQRDFARAFETCDVLVSPTAPTTAFRMGEKLDDPLAMYLNDVATIPVNLAGTPGMSIPVGLAPEDGLPVGLQIMAPAMADDRLYNVGAALERALLDRWGHPILEEAPAL